MHRQDLSRALKTKPRHRSTFLEGISHPAEVVVPQLCVVWCFQGFFIHANRGGGSYFIAVSQWAIYNVPVKFMVYGIYVIVQKSQTLFEHSLDLSSLHHSCMAVCAPAAYTVVLVQFVSVGGAVPGRMDFTMLALKARASTFCLILSVKQKGRSR